MNQDVGEHRTLKLCRSPLGYESYNRIGIYFNMMTEQDKTVDVALIHEDMNHEDYYRMLESSILE